MSKVRACESSDAMDSCQMECLFFFFGIQWRFVYIDVLQSKLRSVREAQRGGILLGGRAVDVYREYSRHQ